MPDSLQPVWAVMLLATAFVSSILGSLAYRAIAVRRQIVAHPNFRSLHTRPTPRGGGIVFSGICISALVALLLGGALAPNLAFALVGGGSVAALVGFADDIRGLRPQWKLLAQVLLAAFALLVFDFRPLVQVPGSPTFVVTALSWLGLVWLMNMYNFVDGIDGMAATSAVFVSVAAISVLLLARSSGAVLMIFGLVAASSVGFAVLNWPPASIFMGDSGSLFLGYTFGVLITKTVHDSEMSVWTWLIIFGYLAGDTTTTTLIRMVVADKWYGEHRSHAYQNLARIWNSHLRVVLLVTAFSVGWLLPLALWSTLTPAIAPAATALAILPVVLWTLRYGPRRSST